MLCFKTNARTIRQDGSSPAQPDCPASIKFTAASLWPTRIFAFFSFFLFSFKKVNKNSPCLLKEKAYAPGHKSGKSYLAHWCAEHSRFPQLELELSAGSELYNTCVEQQRRRSEERREGDIWGRRVEKGYHAKLTIHQVLADMS